MTGALVRLRRRLPFSAAGARRDRFVVFGGAGVLVVSLVALFAPELAPYAPGARVGPSLHPPSAAHPLGTDDVGHDVLSLLLVGARTSLLVGLVTGSLTVLVGLTVGVGAGLAGGRVETAAMRFVDVVLTLPFLPLVIVAAAVLGPSLPTTVAVLTCVMWARPARELRAQVLSVRRREYVRASRAMGASLPHVALRYVVPAVLPIAVAQFAKAVGAAVLLEASLAFLGLGDPSTPSWGTVLFFAQRRSAFLTDAWTWWVVPPGLAITASVVSFTFLALGVERRAGAGRGSASAVGVGGDDGVVSVRSAASVADRSPAPALEVSDLAVRYGDGDAAVDGVEFTLFEDEAVGVVGESGSGKSSFALALLDLLRPPGRASGRVALYADRAADDAPALADVRGDEIAFVPQEAMNALDPRMRLDEQVAEAVLTHRDCDRAAAERAAREALDAVGLGPESRDRYPHELSGGMRQRGVIATALVNDPSVLVVDEPTTGLDVVTTLDLLDLLADLRAERGFSLLMATHDLAAVTRIADRVAVVREGRFVEVGPTDRLRTAPDHPYARELFDARPRLPTDDAPATPAAGPGDGYLTYDGVRKSFDGSAVLSGVDLSVGRGRAVALVGESGAGKSTLGRMAAGLVAPDDGPVTLDGESIGRLRSREPRRLGRTVHYLFQDPYESIPPNRTVGATVREPLDVHGHVSESERPERVRSALRDVGLTPAETYAERYPSQLSGGERQRVAFARALVLEPSVLVADEPTSMLDAPRREELLSLLYDLVAGRGITLLHVTHDVAAASAFADRLAVLHDGRVVEAGPPSALVRHPDHAQTRRLVDAARELSGDAPPDSRAPRDRPPSSGADDP